MNTIKETFTCKKGKVPHGKNQNNAEKKTTVSPHLANKIVERARFNKLNLSRISEQALLSILDYLEPQNHKQSSKFLSTGFFLKESVMVPRAELEPATNGDITL